MTALLNTARRQRRVLLDGLDGLIGRLGGRRDRGDVPGWVLITIMTAGLVTALWALAGPQLGQLFTDAISNVQGP
ncbi:MAG: hypothetical protein ABIS35_04185 [Terracoccus sp.]